MRDVAFSCDDNGAKFLRVTVWSLLSHYHGSEPIRINVLDGFGGHSAENCEKLRELVAKFSNASVRHINVEGAVEPYKDLIMNREHSRWNIFTWTPIFAPQLIADSTGNIVHFDIDMLFNDDVSELFELDLGDNLIAAVAEYGREDKDVSNAVWGRGILPPEAERYFNTGTLVFNAEKCRAERTWEKILAWYREHYDIADRIEQDAWNALYWRRTQLLPLRWNFHDRLIKSYPKWNLAEKYWRGNPPRECLEAALNPAVLHFWGPKKPWKVSHRPYRSLYHEAMRAVGMIPPREPRLAIWHNLVNRRNLNAIAKRLRFINDTTLQQAFFNQRAARKKVKRLLALPFEWLGILLALAIIVPLPHCLMLRMCDLISSVYHACDRKGRKIAAINLALIAPRLSEKSARLIIRRAYRNMTRSVGHAFWTCLNARRRVERVGEINEKIKNFLLVNKPAVTVSAHLGCWEILSQLAYLNGHSMMSVAKDIGTPAMTKLLMRARRSIGQEIVHAEGAFKALMNGIRAGKSLGLLVDQRVSPSDGGIWIRFLSRPMPVSAAPAFFSAKTKSPIIIAWSRPLKNGRYRCEYIASYSPEESRDIWLQTQRCASDLERVIKRHPSCWILNYDYFCYAPTPKMLAELVNRELAHK